ncbi:hypothetical protein F4780DRAFT_545487 [Xylariomycetidae sp. FL0641]|nr:hypothetical protein F4780DRAFT_545487 [Xylariomycetidae sp. FL0641]
MARDETNPLMVQVKAVEDSFVQAVQHALGLTVELGTEVTTNLRSIRANTGQLFFWTSLAVTAILGVIIIELLVRLTRELGKINRYQEVFRTMWQEDQRLERLVVDRNQLNEILEDMTDEELDRFAPYIRNQPKVESVEYGAWFTEFWEALKAARRMEWGEEA